MTSSSFTFSLRTALVADYSPKFLRLRVAINREPQEGDPTVAVLLPDHAGACGCTPCEVTREMNKLGALRLMQDMIDSSAFHGVFVECASEAFEKALARYHRCGRCPNDDICTHPAECSERTAKGELKP